MSEPKHVLRFLCPVILFTFAAACDLFLQKMGSIAPWSAVALTLRGLRFGLFCGSFSFFLGRYARIPYVVLWTLFCTVCAIEAVARFNFGMLLGGDWVLMLGSSSPEEVAAFLKMCSPVIFAVALAGLASALSIGVRLLVRGIYPAVTLKGMACGLAIAMPMICFDCLCVGRVGPLDALITYWLPYSTICNWNDFIDMSQAAKSPELPDGIRLDVSGAQTPLGVVVIGESATRADWGLYGYERPTTSHMSELSDELIIFRNATSSHGLTGPAMRMAFTDATLEHPEKARCTFAQKCVAAGYTCALISAQLRWGRWEGVEKLAFTGCGDVWYLCEQNQADSEASRHDDSLLPEFGRRMSTVCTNMEPNLLFVHLMGSHFPPEEQYPPSWAIYPRYNGDFPPGLDASSSMRQIEQVDRYDNTIAFTDSVLGDMLDRLKKVRRPSFFVYFSDHGETPRAPYWRTESDPDLFAVPLIVWLSPEYRTAYPKVVDDIKAMADRPLRLDRLQSLLLPLARVRVPSEMDTDKGR